MLRNGFAFFATTGVVLSAAYALWLYRRVVFGALEKDSLKAMLDLTPREKWTLYPLFALTILYGVYPMPVFDTMATSVDALISQIDTALASVQTSAPASAVAH